MTVDGSDDVVSGMYGGGGCGTCTHDEVLVELDGNACTASSTCAVATYGVAVRAMRTRGCAIGANRSPKGPSPECCTGAGKPAV